MRFCRSLSRHYPEHKLKYHLYCSEANQLNWQAFALPEEPIYRASFFLTNSISAIEILPRENDRPKLGLLSHLPAGALLHVCGDGFDARTAKVCVNGQYYFVFRQEIDWPEAPVARTN